MEENKIVEELRNIQKEIRILISSIYLIALMVLFILNEIIKVHDYVTNTLIALIVVVLLYLIMITLFGKKGDSNVWEKAN